MTDTSWIALSGSGLGDWGPVSQGTRSFLLDYSNSFYSWERMTGTASFMLFYTSSGFSCIWKLVGRVGTQAGPCAQLVPAGLTVMTGGR